MTELTPSFVGAYCPYLSQHALGRLLAKRIWMISPLGLERRCAKCGEFWPADTEFFLPTTTGAGVLHCWCKACYKEWRAARRAA